MKSASLLLQSSLEESLRNCTSSRIRVTTELDSGVPVLVLEVLRSRASERDTLLQLGVINTELQVCVITECGGGVFRDQRKWRVFKSNSTRFLSSALRGRSVFTETREAGFLTTTHMSYDSKVMCLSQSIRTRACFQFHLCLGDAAL